MDYQEFIQSKDWVSPRTGIDTIPDLNSNMFPFQKEITEWALRKGRACLFEDCGLGKTLQLLVWANSIPGNVIVFAPLAVAQQTVKEGVKFGIECAVSRDGTPKGKITITNYEQLSKFNPGDFNGVVLDESSIIKNFAGKIRNELIENYRDVPFKLCCTATPAPNDIMELANHAEFMGVMKRQEFLATWFVHDGGNTSKWRLKKHAAEKFWKWLATWSVMLKTPSDIGYEDEGFLLPPLNTIEHYLETGIKEEGKLFSEPASTLQKQRGTRRISMQLRIDKASEIVNNTPGPWVVWCELNDESKAMTKAVDGAVELAGADKLESKEQKLVDFSEFKTRVLVTKPKIGGFGMNWQHCSQQMFIGLSHSFELYYQAIRRSWRFGQDRPVDIHVITTDLDSGIVDNVKRKHDDHEKMASEMVKIMSDTTISEIKGTEREKDEYTTGFETGEDWDLYLGDCVEEIEKVDDESIGLSVFSPPFSDLYTYSNSDRDLGNSKNYEEFMVHFSFLVKDLLRVTMPGRNCCVHVMDLPITKEKEGHIGLRDFSGIVIKCFIDNGWYYHSRVTIWKDPVDQMQRTKAYGLLYKQLKKNSAMSRNGLADYIVTFRKPGENHEPITHTNSDFPVEQWQNWASPIWMDIKSSDTLQKQSAREEKDEKHIAPLQLEVIRRLVRLWSNEGDLVLSPFAGIGSEGFVSLQEKRRFVGFELKQSYYKQAAANLKNAWVQGSLF